MLTQAILLSVAIVSGYWWLYPFFASASAPLAWASARSLERTTGSISAAANLSPLRTLRARWRQW